MSLQKKVFCPQLLQWKVVYRSLLRITGSHTFPLVISPFNSNGKSSERYDTTASYHIATFLKYFFQEETEFGNARFSQNITMKFKGAKMAF